MRIHRLAGAEREAALAEVFRPKHRALTLADLCNWQAMITREQLRFGHLIPEQAVGRVRGPELPFDVCVGDHVAPGFAQVPALMEEWLGDLNRRVSSLERKFDNDVPADADLIGEFFQRFEAIHPFVDGNGRTGRLVVNYLTSALGRPEVVISFADRSQFYRAHRSKVAMKAFMLDRLCDAMWSTNGQLGIWVATEAGWLRYRLPDGTLFSFEEDQIDQVRTAWRAEAGEPDAESIRRSPRRGLAWRWLARWWRSR
jgi:hypothetical protein